MVVEKAQGKRGKQLHRSPEHPAFSLEEAIARAAEFYKHENFNYAPVDVAKRHWGYGPKSSSGLRTLAALVHYGLLEESGSGADRKVRLTPFAKTILLDKREGSQERAAALQAAALKPKIYATLWTQLGGKELPSDDSLEYELLTKYAFNKASVRSFIKDFRATVAFAKLGQSATLAGDGDAGGAGSGADTGQRGRQQEPRTMPDVQRTEARVWDLTIPLTGGGQAVLRTPIPLSEEDYALLTAMLESTLKSVRKAITATPAEPQDSPVTA